MNIIHVIALVCFSFMLSVGQIFLKKAVLIAQANTPSGLVRPLITAVLFTWQFWAAIALCGSLVLVWAWLLSLVPLSKAYPFVVLAFVFAAILEHFIFGTNLNPSFFVGCGLIVAGLIVIL
jgi:drug/metabolite transporter (DMT)-like permease